MNNIPTYYPALVNYCCYGAPPELKGLRGSDASTYRNKDGSTTFGLEKIAPPSITADEKLYPTTDLAELVELTAKTWSGSLRFIHGADQWAWKDDKGRWFICPSSRRHVPAGEVYSMLCFVYLVMRATITPAVIEACVAWHRDNPGKRPAARTVIRAAWKPWRETYTAMVSKMNKRSIGPMMRALADHPALASTESEWVLPPREERRPWWTAREVTYLARRECAPSKTTSPTFPGPTPTRVVCMVDGRVIVGSHEERVETVEPIQGLSPSTLHGLYNLIQLQGRHCGRFMRAHRSFFQDYLGSDNTWEIELEAHGVATLGKGGSEDSLISASEIELDIVAARALLAQHGL
jgi:hypothetical protein